MQADKRIDMEIKLVPCFKFILSAKFDNIRAEVEVFVKDRFELFNLIGVSILYDYHCEQTKIWLL